MKTTLSQAQREEAACALRVRMVVRWQQPGVMNPCHVNLFKPLERLTLPDGRPSAACTNFRVLQGRRATTSPKRRRKSRP